MTTQCEIECGDALQLAPDFVAQFDLLYTDPPYSEHVHKSATSQSAGGGTRKRDLGFESLSLRARHACATWAATVTRWSVIYSDVESANWLALSAQARGAEYVRVMPWVRWSMPQLSGDRPPQGFEALVVLHAGQPGKRGGWKPKAKHWNGPGSLTHFDQLALRGDGKHKCEKPLDQALDVVSYFSDVGENVLDPFAGSGTIGLACQLLGRNYCGFELDPVWHAKARTRLQSVSLQPRDVERATRWISTSREPVSQQAEGPSVQRAANRAADVQRVKKALGL